MNRFDNRYQQHPAADRWPATMPSRWRIGNGSVSTEELQAWQLGPAHIDHRVAGDGAPRLARR